MKRMKNFGFPQPTLNLLTQSLLLNQEKRCKKSQGTWFSVPPPPASSQVAAPQGTSPQPPVGQGSHRFPVVAHAVHLSLSVIPL